MYLKPYVSPAKGRYYHIDESSPISASITQHFVVNIF